ncbi:MAG TPA: ferredoxin family protein [Pseudonocardiaceae bacterium]|nr:ferredoxin family protein [Pseudonocardiaceae bacterium]
MDRTCLDECPVDCIYPGARMLYIHPDECIDCGACEPVCPQDAIFNVDELPEELEPFTAVNSEFFTADGIGPATDDNPAVDHPVVVARPPREE